MNSNSMDLLAAGLNGMMAGKAALTSLTEKNPW